MKILVIAPYKGLRDLFYEINKEMNLQMDVEVENLLGGVRLAKALEHKNYDMIISRGATARLLREHCAIPVVDVKISGYDILRTLTLFKGYTGKIGIMSYENVIHGADFVGKLLDIDLQFYTIQDESESETCLKKAVQDKVQLIIGDTMSTSAAVKFGLHGILINSGKESVMEAIQEAEKIYYYTQKEKERNRTYTTVFNHMNEGIVIVNQKGECQFSNYQAADMLGVSLESMQEGIISERITMLNFSSVFTQEAEERFENIAVNHIEINFSKFPILDEGKIIGGAAILSPANTPREGGPLVLNNGLETKQAAKLHFNQLIARSGCMTKLIESAKKISHSDFPVILYGEPGTGKNSLAEAIHNESERRLRPYIYVDCKSYTEERLERRLLGVEGEEKGAFEQAYGGTLFIDSICDMPMTLQAVVANAVRTKRLIRMEGKVERIIDVRLIIGSMEKLCSQASDGHLMKKLYREIHGFTLKIPPLRERKEDIDDFVRLFIAEINTKTGKQIVGVKPDALEILKSFAWQENVQQLKRFLEQMCVLSDGPFIEKQVLMPYLEEQVNREEQQAFDMRFSYKNKTLEQIEREIIEQILQEEDFNQSKASKRLGIDRSTLWRKLKFREKDTMPE